jgi:MoaA/NifB/PqqE/SkfB family radical SAM enzyme
LVEIKLNEKFIRPCFATEKFVTLYDDGAVSPCEVLEDRVKLGSIKDYDYDFYKLQKMTKMKGLYSKEIVESKCNCEWQCALPMNMLYDPSVYFRILKGLTFPSKIVQPVSQEVYGEAK